MCRHARLRMESCVAAILDVSGRLGDGQIGPEIIQRFERIRAYIKMVSEELLDEADIGRIEDATNELMNEIASNVELRRISFRPLGWIN